MAKPKLTDAIKPAATAEPSAKSEPVIDFGAGNVGLDLKAGEKLAKVDASSDPDDADDSDDDTVDPGATAEPAKAESKPDRTIAEYREAFGTEAGSVYFCDGVSFADACKAHMAKQQEALVAAQKERDEFKAKATEFAAQLKGEGEPLNTVATGKPDARKDPHEAYAQHAMNKLQGTKS